MAKLYFRYGAMSSSKTANAIMVKYNYGEQGQKALLVKPRTDTRDGVHIMKSRSGVMDECTLFDEMDWEAVKRTSAGSFLKGASGCLPGRTA